MLTPHNFQKSINLPIKHLSDWYIYIKIWHWVWPYKYYLSQVSTGVSRGSPNLSMSVTVKLFTMLALPESHSDKLTLQLQTIFANKPNFPKCYLGHPATTIEGVKWFVSPNVLLVCCKVRKTLRPYSASCQQRLRRNNMLVQAPLSKRCGPVHLVQLREDNFGVRLVYQKSL